MPRASSPAARCGSTRAPAASTVDGKPLKLTSHEYRLLSYLMHHTGRDRVAHRADRAPLRPGFRPRFQHHRGVRRPPAQEARRRRDPDGARPRLYPASPRPAEARAPRSAGRSRQAVLAQAASIAVRLAVSAAVLEPGHPADRRARSCPRSTAARPSAPSTSGSTSICKSLVAAVASSRRGERRTADSGPRRAALRPAAVGLVLADRPARRDAARDRAARHSLFGGRLPPRPARRRSQRRRDPRGLRAGPGRAHACASSSATSTSARTAASSSASPAPADEIERDDRGASLALLAHLRAARPCAGCTTCCRCASACSRWRSCRRRRSARSGAARPTASTGEYPRRHRPARAAELNLLLDTNREILDRARTQVGNLAHALKTPLSVIVNEAGDGAGRRSADKVARAGRHHARPGELVPRSRPRRGPRRHRSARVTEVEPVIEGIAAHVRARSTATRASRFDGDGRGRALRFRGERQDLEEMVGNLIDNAGKWAAGAHAGRRVGRRRARGRPRLAAHPGRRRRARACRRTARAEVLQARRSGSTRRSPAPASASRSSPISPRSTAAR